MRERLKSIGAALPHPVRWIAVLIAGITCVVLGLVLLVLPGPGIPLLLLGLVILASEFAWAAAILDRLRRHSTSAIVALKSRTKPTGSSTHTVIAKKGNTP